MNDYVPNLGSNQSHLKLFSTHIKSEINLDIKQEASEVEDVKIDIEHDLLHNSPATVKSEFVEEVTANENAIIEAGLEKCSEQMTVKLDKDFCGVITIKCDKNIKKERAYNAKTSRGLNKRNALEYFKPADTTYGDSQAGECVQMYKCKFCDYKTKIKDCLLRHFRIKHDEDAELYRCDICEYKTKVSYELKRHKTLTHTQAFHWHRCEFCDFKTKYISHLKRHKRSWHFESECHRCNFCESTFKTRDTLNNHMRYKHNENTAQYQCVHCEYTTKHRQHLKHHINNKHNEDSHRYKCHLCEYESKSKCNLRKHIIFKHELPSEQLRCHFCAYETKHKSYLRKHIKSRHEKSVEHHHQCHFCKNIYKTKDNLKRHIKNKHNENGKLYECAHCNYTAGVEYYLKRHVKVKHKWPLCQLSNYKTNVKEELSVPNREEYTEEADHYRCFHCDYATKNKCLLRDHIVNIHNEPDDQKDIEILTDELDSSGIYLESVKNEDMKEITTLQNCKLNDSKGECPNS